MRSRPAVPDEHGVLSRIALAAKSHWSYPPEAIAAWRAELTVSSGSIAERPTFVAELDGRAVGFFQLDLGPERAELDHLWVLPEAMGKGVGRALVERAVREVAAAGYGELAIDADPHAEGFYLACGAVRTGERPAPIEGEPRRARPQLVLSVGRGEVAGEA